jgi:hypothetical protein
MSEEQLFQLPKDAQQHLELMVAIILSGEAVVNMVNHRHAYVKNAVNLAREIQAAVAEKS